MIFLLKNFLISLTKYQMAKQRMINTKIWDDTYFTDLKSNEKLIFIYLLTNSLTNLSWIYEIQIKRISYDTWIWIQDIKKIIDKFSEDKKIYLYEWYIMIKNFIKNQNLNPSVEKWIERELLSIPKNILAYFLALNTDNLTDYIQDVDSLSTECIQGGLLNLTKLNLTKLNSSDDEILEKSENKYIKEYLEFIENNKNITSIILKVFFALWYKPTEPLEEFRKWVQERIINTHNIDSLDKFEFIINNFHDYWKEQPINKKVNKIWKTTLTNSFHLKDIRK